MAARTNPALSTFLDSMFLDSMAYVGTADGESRCMRAADGPSSPKAVVCNPEPASGQAQTREQHVGGSTEDVGSGIEEKAQKPGAVPCFPHHGAASPAQTNAVGTIIQAYNARAVQLERQCWELTQENKQLRRGLEAERLQRERVSELNLRLSCEVRRARGELTAASAQAERLGTELRNAQQMRAAARGKLRLARRKAARLGNICQRSEGPSAALSQPCLVQSTLTELQSEPLLQEEKLDEDEISTAEEQVPVVEPTIIEAPPGLSRSTTTSMFSSTVQPCHCGDHSGNICLFGCLHHATYSRSLLLAHHTLHRDISRGPPGLEQAGGRHQNEDVAFRLVTRRRAGLHQQQPRL